MTHAASTGARKVNNAWIAHDGSFTMVSHDWLELPIQLRLSGLAWGKLEA